MEVLVQKPGYVPVLCVLCSLILQRCEGVVAWNSLLPPVGNSILMKSKSINGVNLYECVNGNWLLRSAFAMLVDVANPTAVVGNYTFLYHPRVPRYVGTWTLVNSDGDAAESGSLVSIVAGKQIASFSFSRGNGTNFLAEASMHKFAGTASSISYISGIISFRRVAPKNICCHNQELMKVPFHAQFHFWRQDLLPPSVPQQLAVPSQKPVESFFCKGIVKYVYSNRNWTRRNIVAKLYDVPGGVETGGYYIRQESNNAGGNYHWNVNNPNGFEIVGKVLNVSASIASGSLPWSLYTVTSGSGNISLLGPYTFVQMVSTRGGLPPASPSSSISKPLVGDAWKSPFTAIFWFYTKS
eukprot:c23212_g1_i1 orf=117-1178(+)